MLNSEIMFPVNNNNTNNNNNNNNTKLYLRVRIFSLRL